MKLHILTNWEAVLPEYIQIGAKRILDVGIDNGGMLKICFQSVLAILGILPEISPG